MFGHHIGARDDRPSIVGISGPMERGCWGRAWFPLRRVGRVRTAPPQGDLRSTARRARRTLHHPLLSLQCRDTIHMCMLSQGLSTHGVVVLHVYKICCRGITSHNGVMHTPNGSAAAVHLTSQASGDSYRGYLLLVHVTISTACLGDTLSGGYHGRAGMMLAPNGSAAVRHQARRRVVPAPSLQ